MTGGRATTRSLRTTLLVGLAAVFVPLLAAFAAAVWGRARDEAQEALRDRLLVRAEVLAGLVEIDGDRFEMELPIVAMPEYVEVGSGAAFVVHDWEGEAFLASPSLGDHRLPPPAPWTEEGRVFEEVASGPGGRPHVVLTLSFRVLPFEGEEGEAVDLPDEQQRWRVQVALDATERDRGLARLAAFLAIAGGGAVLLALLGGRLLARRVLRPVRAMTETAARLTPEDPDLRMEPDRIVRELHGLAETLNRTFDRLAEALAQQKRFTADASHELRTPASVLLANAEILLRRDRTPEEYRRGLQRQVETVKRMSALLDDLLLLARGDAGRGELRREPVDLADTAREVCAEHAAMAREKGVELRGPDATEVVLDGDPLRLAQCVSNLVGNAVRHAPAGGHVRVRVDGDGDAVRLAVEDDGPGIAPEHHRRIFERFYRVEGHRKGGGGTGLGLAIVAWIVVAHGGRVEVDSRPGAGATFRVTLPRRSAAEGDVRRVGPVRSSGAA